MGHLEICVPVQKSTLRESTLKTTVDNCRGNPVEESEKNSEKKSPIQLFSSPLPQQQKKLGNELNCGNKWEQPSRGSKIPRKYNVFNSPPKQQFNHNHHQQLSQIYYNNIKSQEQYYERLPQLQQRHTVDNSRGKPVEKSHQIIYQRPLPHQQKILGNECLEMIENKWEQFNCGSNISEEDSNRREQCSCATKIPKKYIVSNSPPKEQFNHHHQLWQIYCNNLKFQEQYYQLLLQSQQQQQQHQLQQQQQQHQLQLHQQQYQLQLQQQQYQLQLQQQRIQAQQQRLQLQQQQIQQQKIRRRKSPTNKPLLEAPKYSQDIIDLYNDALKKPFEFSRLVRVGAFPSQNEN